MRVNCFLDQTDLCKSKNKKNVYLSKTEGFNKKREVQRNKFFLRANQKKVFIRKVVDYIYYEFYFYSFSIQTKKSMRGERSKTKKQKTTLY